VSDQLFAAPAASSIDERAPSLSEGLARYAVGLRLEDVPQDVRDKAALCILDTIGCAIAGSATRAGGIVARHVARGQPGACSLFGHVDGVDLESAVLANVGAAHVLELDDGHRPSDNHLGCVVVPAALAAAEQVGAGGADLLRAVLVGYDVMGRIGQAICLPRMKTPFHGTATTGGFGAAAAAGVLLGLDERQMGHALAIAGTGGAGLREAFTSGGDCKAFQVGRAAWTGVDAALLAAMGLEGPREILEGRFGFLDAMTPMARPALVLADLGRRFAVMESAFKVHAACGILFTAIDACLTLRAEHGLDPGRVEAIEVALPDWVRDDPVFARLRPQTVGEARFSVPFVVAAALVHGEVSPRQLSAEGMADPRIRAIEDRVRVTADPEVDRIFHATNEDDFFFYPAAVRITTGAATHRRLEESPRGYDLRRALTPGEVVAKFIGNAAGVIGRDRAEEAARAMLELSSLPDVGRLRDLWA
jgi:2-methylcitrate dehydratase PrpD